MKIRFQQILFLNVLFFLLFTSANAVRACSCIKNGTVDESFAETPNVVILKLQSVEKSAEGEKSYGVGGIKQSRLTVEKVYKGNLIVGSELIFAQGGGADCIWTFGEESIGTEYLFYLSAKPLKGKVWTAFTCSRSNSRKYAGADLLYLDKLAKVKGKTRFSGMLTQSLEATTTAEESIYKSLPERTINIVGNGKNIKLKTDENGVYEIYDLPAGKYKITPEKVDGYKFSAEKNDWLEVELKAGSHTEQNLNFSIDNEISGKVFDANGKVLEDVCLDLLPARGEKAQYFYQGDCTDKNGTFKFDGIPVGTYLIIINDDGEITSDEPFGTFYYPSTTRREEAAEITIGAGDFH